MKQLVVLFISLSFLMAGGCTPKDKEIRSKQDNRETILAARPPMGWNSWICFGASVTEEEVKANTDFMAERLKEFGWEYIVIDAGWYAPGMVHLKQYEAENPYQLIDQYGRLIVDTEKFPSAAIDGKGLKSLANYIHSKGLKLGIHIMRGIPVQAVEQNTPIKGTSYRARDIINPDSRCQWYRGFYGIDMSKPGAQEYYNSILELYASWGVDYIKADDLLWPIYAHDEIEAIAEAIRQVDRPILLSLSPGPAPTENVKHMKSVAQMWRISADFWDNWKELKEQFVLCRKWQSHVSEGHWADADMLPIGPMAQRAMRGAPRATNFTIDEQYTLMSLWAVFRSPLMLGCNLPEIDDFTLSLITNKEVLELNQYTINNRELFERDGVIAWYAQNESKDVHYVAIFNTTDKDINDYIFSLQEINYIGRAFVKELWSSEEVPVQDNGVKLSINKHGAIIIKIQSSK